MTASHNSKLSRNFEIYDVKKILLLAETLFIFTDRLAEHNLKNYYLSPTS